MPHERRHFIRVSFDAPAQLATADQTLSVHVLDLSLKGALVAVAPGTLLHAGALCHLTIPLTSTSDHIAMSAEVAHVEGHFAGLLCRGIDLDSVTHLRRLIELQLGAPALLERDLAELMAAAPPRRCSRHRPPPPHHRPAPGPATRQTPWIPSFRPNTHPTRGRPC